MATALAVDVGGTKLAVGLVDHRGAILGSAATPTWPGAGPGRVPGADVGRDEAGRSGGVATGRSRLEDRRVPPVADGPEGAEVLFGRLVELVDRLRADVGPGADGEPVGCGVGCGGPMAPGGTTVSPLNIGVWRDFPLRGRLAEHLDLPVFVDNDAKALALAEGWLGAARGVPDFLAMVVSTGVGGGLVLEGRLLDGRLGNAGHIGHVIVEPDGRACRCGAAGCLEAEASGTSIAAITGRPAAAADAATVARTGRLVGRAVASVANLLDLGLACAGGSVALGFGPPFFAAAQAELDRSARLPFTRGARIVPAGLGPDAPLTGAAAVAFRALGHDIGIS